MINSYIIINVSLRLPLVSYRYCIGEKTWVREVKWLAQGQIISDKQHQDRILIQCSSSHVVLPFLHFFHLPVYTAIHSVYSTGIDEA